MAYSRWRDGFWFTSELTDAPHISGSALFINPKVGDSKTFTYKQLMEANLTTDWVSKNFPDAPDRWLGELLRFIYIFIDDMTLNVYRYHGYRLPTGATDVKKPNNEERGPVLDQRNGGTRGLGVGT